jgi:hypothetical protein
MIDNKIRNEIYMMKDFTDSISASTEYMQDQIFFVRMKIQPSKIGINNIISELDDVERKTESLLKNIIRIRQLHKESVE